MMGFGGVSPEMAAAIQHAASAYSSSPQMQNAAAMTGFFPPPKAQTRVQRGAGMEAGAFTAPHPGLGPRAYGFISPEQFHLAAEHGSRNGSAFLATPPSASSHLSGPSPQQHLEQLFAGADSAKMPE